MMHQVGASAIERDVFIEQYGFFMNLQVLLLSERTTLFFFFKLVTLSRDKISFIVMQFYTLEYIIGRLRFKLLTENISKMEFNSRFLMHVSQPR